MVIHAFLATLYLVPTADPNPAQATNTQQQRRDIEVLFGTLDSRVTEQNEPSGSQNAQNPLKIAPAPTSTGDGANQTEDFRGSLPPVK